jgi:hypothetical protein
MERSDFRPAAVSDDDGRVVVSGPTPPGVARVVVIDDRGDECETTLGAGTWHAALGDAGFSEPLVRYEDSAGEIVAPALPEGPRTRVTDADVPCPACGAVSWVQIGIGVHCERCGLAIGPRAGFGYWIAPPPRTRQRVHYEPDVLARVQGERFDALAGAPFPIYGVAGRVAEVVGETHGHGGLTTVTVGYADGRCRLQVDSGISEHWGARDHLRGLLAAAIGIVNQDDCARSEAASRVHHAHAWRTAQRRAARAEFEQRDFVIDGRPEPFSFLAAGEDWAAVRDHYGFWAQMLGRGVDPATVTLVRVTGLEVDASIELARRAAGGQLLTRVEVARLIDEHGLGEHRETILATIRPGYRLDPTRRSPHRIGGLPDLAPGEQWPHDEDGITYTFVAQIDCSQLPPVVSDFTALAWNHGRQLLRIFAALDARVPNGGPAVAFACAPDAPLTRTAVPPRPDPMPEHAFEPDDDSLRELVEQPVRLTPLLTAPHSWDEGRYAFALCLAAGGAAPQHRASQLLGHAINEQGEDPVQAGPWLYADTTEDDWCVLLNLTEHPEMDFGDGGSLAVVIRRDDLAAGRYDRLATDQSMG